MATAADRNNRFMLSTGCWALLVMGLAGPAWAEGKSVLSLGRGRGYDHATLFQVVLTGESMRIVQSALEADGFSITAGESFNAAALGGHHIVFLGLFDPSEGLTSAERIALNAFVRGGGALIYLGDNESFNTPNAAAASLFGMSFGSDPSAVTASQIPDGTHPIIHGPAGMVQTYDGTLNLPGFFGGIAQLGPHAHPVLGTGSRTVVAVIEPGVLQPGSGPVIFISDANGFSDPGVGTVNGGDNLTLIRNIFAFAGGMASCITNTDCSDGLFCNGEETCVGSQCRAGVFPCLEGQGCHEITNQCGPCDDDVQCPDGLFCNGDESCVDGVCRHGSRPCDPTQGCHEQDNTCGPCESDAECDDGMFCNGIETCDAGTCHPGSEMCTADCEHCDESAGACAPCMLDLNGDGFIGTGDFAFFAGCFGACFPAGHVCLSVNFDESQDGCVGTGDFAAFSGCFGGSCTDCGNCAGPGEGNTAQIVSAAEGGATIALVSVRTATKTDAVDDLPESESNFNLGEFFLVEVWAGRSRRADDGLAAVYVDLNYDPSVMRVTEVIPSDMFALFARGRNQPAAGQVSTLGGCAQLTESQAGVDPAWVRVTSVRMVAERTGPATVTTASAGNTFGIAVVGQFGNLSPSSVAMGRLDLTLGAGGEIAPAPQFGNAPARPR